MLTHYDAYANINKIHHIDKYMYMPTIHAYSEMHNTHMSSTCIYS